jgi:hypothetical protein
MSSQCAGDSEQRKRGCVTRTWKESAIGNENTIDSYAWSGMCRSRKKRERHRGLGLHDSQVVNIFSPNFFLVIIIISFVDVKFLGCHLRI